jgi:hypothetical protein
VLVNWQVDPNCGVNVLASALFAVHIRTKTLIAANLCVRMIVGILPSLTVVRARTLIVPR